MAAVLPDRIIALGRYLVSIVLGWMILLHGHGMDEGRIGDFALTDDERIGLATRQGIKLRVEQVP